MTTTIKPKPIVMSNTTLSRSKQPPVLKKPMVSFRTYTEPQSSLPPSNSRASKQTKPINSSVSYSSSTKTKVISTTTNHKSVPPVPPRKSSIPRPGLTSQRNTSTILSLRKPQISHL